MQDWPLEVADPNRVEEFLHLYAHSEDEEVRFALMELILYSLDERDDRGEARWSHVEELMVAAGPLHAQAVIYWSCLEQASDGAYKPISRPDEQFGITPLARRALARLRHEIGFTELVLG
ncbi:MAG: hypothetical protein AAF645_08665 [Myxococcota bacterium]